MPILTPAWAGNIAHGVYGVRVNSAKGALKTGIGTEGLLAVDDGTAARACFGAPRTIDVFFPRSMPERRLAAAAIHRVLAMSEPVPATLLRALRL